MKPTPPQHFELAFDPGHPSFDGHFPGQPLVPGVLLLGEIVGRIERTIGSPIQRLTQARFSRAIRPAEVVSVSWSREGAAVRFSATIDTPHGRKPVADGRLVLAGVGA